jgi:DNA invertase Pin-like site-specific DNA recombinase
VGYARVSTDDQTNAPQADAMAQANVDVVFPEEASGANTARPVLADTLASLRTRETRWSFGGSIDSAAHWVT